MNPKEKICRTCRWWGYEYDGCCAKITMNEYDETHIQPEVKDDYNFIQLKTAPDFGCTLWDD